MTFLPDNLPDLDQDLPTIFARSDGFSVDDELLPELRGHINYDRPAEQRWKAYRGGGFEPCDRGTPGARLYLRVEVDVDGIGPQTIDVPPGSHASLKEFVENHRDERVWLTIAARGKYFTIRFAPDDGQPMAEPTQAF